MLVLFIVMLVLAVASFCVGAAVKKSGGYNAESTSKVLKVVIPIAMIVMMGISMLVCGIKIIDATEVGVVKTFGEITATVDSGLRFVNPLTQTVSRYDMRVHVREAVFATYTKDAQAVDVAIEYQYEPQRDAIMDVAKKYGSYEVLEAKISKVVEERTKIVIARYSAMPLLENRANLSFEVAEEVSHLEAMFPVNFTSVVVSNLDFSDTFEKSVEAKMTAEQDALRAEQEKKTALVKAEQEREVAKIEAEARIAQATGEAEAMEITKEALMSMPDEYIQSIYIEKWNGVLPQIVAEGSSLMLNPNINN